MRFAPNITFWNKLNVFLNVSWFFSLVVLLLTSRGRQNMQIPSKSVKKTVKWVFRGYERLIWRSGVDAMMFLFLLDYLMKKKSLYKSKCGVNTHNITNYLIKHKQRTLLPSHVCCKPHPCVASSKTETRWPETESQWERKLSTTWATQLITLILFYYLFPQSWVRSVWSISYFFYQHPATATTTQFAKLFNWGPLCC